jgi:hypothetical protein
MGEITRSYVILFNPVEISSTHSFFNIFGAWRACWCLSCTSRRLMQQEFQSLRSNESVLESVFFDPLLEKLSVAQRTEWNQHSFPHLWSRLTILEAALQEAKPWNFWVLFRDRREKLPFWTFLFVPPCAKLIDDH